MLSYAIEVENITRAFEDKYAVNGINLNVKAGEIYGFLGPNGAGKSTTVLMLTTLLPASSGRAIVGGYDITRQAAQVRTVIGAALQEVALDPYLTAYEHLMFQGAMYGLPIIQRKQRANELLNRVGLAEAANRKTGQFSGGMKRRLDLALALLHRPQILFLDEPTTGLDPQSRRALWEEVKKMARQEGVTIFLTTQYLEEADVLADRVGIIDRGRIVAEDTPTRLKEEIGHHSLVLTPHDRADYEAIILIMSNFGTLLQSAEGTVAARLKNGTSDVAHIIRALDGANIALANMQLNAPTLDDVFMTKTGRKLEGALEDKLEGVA